MSLDKLLVIVCVGCAAYMVVSHVWVTIRNRGHK